MPLTLNKVNSIIDTEALCYPWETVSAALNQTGSGSTETTGGFSCYTGSTANSTSGVLPYPWGFLTSSPGAPHTGSLGQQNATNYSKRIILTGIFYVSAYTTNGAARYQYGGKAFNVTTFGSMTEKGFGIVINGTSIKLQVHDGTTLTTTASLATHSQTREYVKIDSLGNGTVNLYINNVFVGSTTGGPTGVGSNPHSFRVSAENGSDSAVQRMLLTNAKAWFFF